MGNQTRTVSLPPPPCLGEHSRELFREELGVGDGEYQELVSLDVTGTV